MRNFIILTLASCFMLSPAYAASKPSEISPVITKEQAYGVADLSVLWMDVYQISLWTDANHWSFEAPFALSITYDMNFTSEELTERTFEEMLRISDDAQSLKATFDPILREAFPNVAKGDRITALYKPEGHVSFYHNGKPTKSVHSKSFAEYFFNIWLGSKTSEPKLRQTLLGVQ